MGRNNADSGLFTKKIRAFSELSRGQSAISRHARCFPKFVVGRKIFLSALWQGSLGSSVEKPSLHPALSLSVSQKHQLTIKARMEKSSMDVAMAINQCSLTKSTSMAQVFKTVEVFRFISFEDLKNWSFK